MDINKYENGLFFEDSYQKELKEKFYYPDADPEHGPRLFFDNSGGSLRLKAAVEAKAKIESYPDCPERFHERSLYLKGIVNEGMKQIREIVFGADNGTIMTELTASQCMWQMVSVIMQNVKGSNAVVSVLEHPSAYDAIEFYCKKTGREMRVAYPDPKTGKITPEEVAKLVDKDTVLVSIMAASNVAGSIMDLEGIVNAARSIKPDVYIISDAVQHTPHAKIDMTSLKLDGMNFAPYKFFGIRGCGYAYVSDRMAQLPHHKLIRKDPSVFELGTPSPGNFAAMLAVIDYVCEIGKHYINSNDRRQLYCEGMDRIHLQERALLHRLMEGSDEATGLRHIDNVDLSADPESVAGRDLIAAVKIRGYDVVKCREEYQRRGITVCDRAPDSIYSKRIVEALGANEGVMRVSPMHCHSKEDIDHFLRVTKEMAEEFGK